MGQLGDTTVGHELAIREAQLRDFLKHHFVDHDPAVVLLVVEKGGVGDLVQILEVQILEVPKVVGHRLGAFVRNLVAVVQVQRGQLGAVLRDAFHPRVLEPPARRQIQLLQQGYSSTR